MLSVGVIGLGVMGALIARNLLKAGHSVTVFARRAEAMALLVSAGAQPAGSPAEVASQSDVTLTMLLDTRAVEDVTLGAKGIVEGASPGSVVIDHSTIAPDAARRIAAALRSSGIEMLDAPVSGGVAMAEAGALSIMVGGAETALERVRPVLQCYGKAIVHIGPSARVWTPTR
jgi:2-hydroxy-3-oxopropionate reductase